VVRATIERVQSLPKVLNCREGERNGEREERREGERERGREGEREREREREGEEGIFAL
jgi:hypothetical protein